LGFPGSPLVEAVHWVGRLVWAGTSNLITSYAAAEACSSIAGRHPASR